MGKYFSEAVFDDESQRLALRLLTLVEGAFRDNLKEEAEEVAPPVRAAERWQLRPGPAQRAGPRHRPPLAP